MIAEQETRKREKGAEPSFLSCLLRKRLLQIQSESATFTQKPDQKTNLGWKGGMAIRKLR